MVAVAQGYGRCVVPVLGPVPVAPGSVKPNACEMSCEDTPIKCLGTRWRRSVFGSARWLSGAS